MKSILVFNDEAHHCYREKPGEDDEGELKGDDKKEARKTTKPRDYGSLASKPSTANLVSHVSLTCQQHLSFFVARATLRVPYSLGR